VATFHFEVKGLGHWLTDTELDELKRSRCGDSRGRQATLAESPAQLLLEAVASKNSTKKGPSSLQQSQIPEKSSADLGNSIVSPPVTRAPETLPEDGKKRWFW